MSSTPVVTRLLPVNPGSVPAVQGLRLSPHIMRVPPQITGMKWGYDSKMGLM